MNPAMRGGPLQGFRVVELTKVWAGPYVGKLLAYLGAEVIRVESEGSLDVTRFYGVDDINNAPGFQSVNPEKLSVQIDMKSEEGIALLLDLLKQSDMVVENLRPGAIERLGLGYDVVREINPAIVYVSMSMYGSDGPLNYQTGYAPCFAALGGLSAQVGYQGEAPSGMNVRYADSTFGTMAAYGALVALYHSRRTGVGQFVDVSAVECMSSMVGDALVDYNLNGVIRSCDGNRHDDMAPHGSFPCRDGEWISIAIATDADWAALVECMGRAELAAHHDLAMRKAVEPELDAVLATWTVEQDAEELVQVLQGHGIAAGRCQNSLQLVADAQLWATGFYREVVDGEGRSKTTTGSGWQMSEPAQCERGAPGLGEHNAYVLGEILGLSGEEQAQLFKRGVTR